MVLPRLVTSYERHLAAVAPAADGPVIRALRLVLNDEIEDWRAGERLVQRLVTRPHDVAAVYELMQRLESAVVGAGARSRAWYRFPAQYQGVDVTPSGAGAGPLRSEGSPSGKLESSNVAPERRPRFSGPGTG